MTTYANEKLRRIMREPRRGMVRRAAERLNPAIVVGAILAACVLWLVAGVAITDRVVMGECKTRMVQA